MASDIVITPNRGSTSVNAKIDFTGASTASSQIRLEVLPDNSLSFVGTTGSLFSIADSVTGSLMSVNDASGLPILEVFDTDKVVMGQYNQNTLVVNGTKVGIGTASPTDKLTIAGVSNNGITFTGSNATLTSNTNLIGVAGTNIYLRPGSGYTVTVDTGNGLYVTSGESRALLFRDAVDTGYYVDPGSTSNLNGLTVAGTITGSISGNAATATTATTATNWGTYGAVPAAGTSFGTANTIGRSDANGYAYFYYINSSTSNNENGTVSQFVITNGSDNFYRKASLSHVKSQMGLSASDNPQFNSIGLAIAASGTAGSISLNQSGTRSWSITPTGGNLAFASGDGSGALTYNSNIILHAGNYNSYAPTLTGTGASGTWGISISGNAATATSADQIDGVPFRNSISSGPVNADNLDSNGITYYTSGVTNFSGNSTDGALYSQAYSSSWQHQIAGDYRSGQIALRGKNSGTWQSWRTVLDSSNYTSYVGNGTLTLNTSGNGISGSTSFTANQSGAGTFTVISNATVNNTANTIMYRGGSGEVYVGDVYSSQWFRNYGTAGLYNQDYGNHWYATGNDYWNLAGNNASNIGIILRSGGHQGTIRGYVYADSNNHIGFLNNGGSWRLRVVSGDYTLADGSSIRGQLFYDSNDTNYYIDPASTGTSANFAGNIIVANGRTDAYIYMGDTDEGQRVIHNNSNRIGFLNQSSGWGAWCDDSGYWQSDTSIRGPIFYDSNDTNYWVDPANGGFYLRGGTSNRVTYYTNDSGIQVSNPEGSGTTIRIGAAWDIPGIYNNTSLMLGSENTITFRTQNVERGYMDNGANFYAYGSMRSPIFYDYNDTNYYIDPASTSRVNVISFVSGASFGPYLQFNNQSNLRLQAGQQSGAIGISGYDFNGNWKFQLYGDSSGYGFLNGNWAGWDLLKSVSGNLYLNNQSTYYIGTNEIYYNRVYGIADIRSPIFYDNNDTGYYCDPNGYSNLKNITNVYYAKNGVYNNLGNPSVDEKALFHGQFNNKFRFWAPQTQEESTNGTTWTTSTRATSQQLLDLMLGEGQGTSFTAIPAPGTGNAGYYRLTWDSTISGSPAYCFLDAVYCYNSTSGNNVTFTVEAQDSGTSNWVTIATGTISNWPGHTYIPHSSLPYVANSTAGYYKKVRLTFAITSAAAYGTGLTLYGIEWWGGYPAGRRNVEYFDSNRNVFWPAKVYGTQFVDQNNTGYYLDPDGSSNLNTLSITGNTNLGNGNGDAVRIDDILYVGASDSGDSHLYFGEDSSSWYGAHWYWDSGYTHYWYSRNGGTDSTLMQYATNDTTKITFGRNIEFNNYGKGIIGTYASTRYQGVFAMGESYKLPDDGNGVGTLYGIAWSHPNTGGIAGNLASHGMLILENGAFKGAWGGGRLVTTEQVRGTSFYDYNNTSYYLDPDGSSNLWRPAWETYERWNSHPRLIDAGGQRPSITSDTGYWTGTTGWGTSYGTWATYWKYGAGFFDCWGTSSDHPQGSQYVHAQGIQSGQHAAASDGSTGYGWQMVGAGDAANRWWLRGKWAGTTRSWYEIALYNSNVGGNLYADAFYDSGDTGYYLNPAGYSNLNQVSTWFKAKDQNTNWTTGFQNTPVSGMTWHGDVSSGGPTGTWWFYQSMRHSNSSNYWGTQIAYGWEDNANEIYQRNITSNSFSGWVRYLNTNNYTSIGVLIASSSPTITGTWLFASNKGSGVYSGNTTTSPLQVWSNDGGTAFMSFHRSGSYAVNMGLDPDNVFRIGGWSASAGRLTLDMSGNLWSASSMRSSIFYDQDDTTYFINPATDARLNGAVRLDGSLGVGTAASGTAGEIRATNNITAYYSDDRLKTKLGTIENPIEKVKALSGFYFEANETAVALGYQKKREVGVSAQEVQAILPEIIAPAPIDDKYMTVRYEKLIPLLIEAIKEQQKQIEELKSLLSNNK